MASDGAMRKKDSCVVCVCRGLEMNNMHKISVYRDED